MTRCRASLHAAAVATLLGAGCGLTGPTPARFSHDKLFVITGSHQVFTCEQCHVPTAASFTHALGGCECFQCHREPDVTPAHAGVSGFVYAYDACIACHKDGKTGGKTVGLPVDHPFPVAQGTKHAGIPCSQCHGATKAEADLKCNACHGGVAVLDSNHAGITGYSSASPSCYDCHPQGTVNVNHAALTPFPITHGGATSCDQCHSATKGPQYLRCYGCHDAPASHSGFSGFQRRSSAQCYSCHQSGQGGN